MILKNNSVPERYYSIDMLRAIMMIMGVFFHSAVIFCHSKNIQDWPIFDIGHSYFFDILVSIIHSFRMHLFFFVSGFTTSILYHKKGLKYTLINRFKRIILPFIFGYFIICSFVSYLSILINNNALEMTMTNIYIHKLDFLSLPLYHLWFLYYLIYFILIGCIFEYVSKGNVNLVQKANTWFKNATQKFWVRFFCLSGVILIYFLCTGKNHFYTPLNFEVSLSSFVAYFIFFACGWLVYKTDSLFYLSKESPLLLMTIGIVFYFLDNANIIFKNIYAKSFYL
jgi:hypothetical protein